jgi:hypothetical protein
VSDLPLDRALDAARNVVRELRSRGLGIEAEIVTQALAVASAATTHRERYEHALISLHELACEALDEIEKERPSSLN